MLPTLVEQMTPSPEEFRSGVGDEDVPVDPERDALIRRLALGERRAAEEVQRTRKELTAEMAVQQHEAEMAVMTIQSEARAELFVVKAYLESEMLQQIHVARLATVSGEANAACQASAAAERERVATFHAQELWARAEAESAKVASVAGTEVAEMRELLTRARAEMSHAFAAEHQQARLAATAQGRAQEAERAERLASARALEAEDKAELAVRTKLYAMERELIAAKSGAAEEVRSSEMETETIRRKAAEAERSLNIRYEMAVREKELQSDSRHRSHYEEARSRYEMECEHAMIEQVTECLEQWRAKITEERETMKAEMAENRATVERERRLLREHAILRAKSFDDEVTKAAKGYGSWSCQEQ